MAASTVYYNFSADCVNSNYTGFSSRIPYMNLTSGFIGSSFNFANIFDCIENCTSAPTQLSGCFKFISTASTPTYPVYSGVSNTGFYVSSEACIDSNPCPVEQQFTYFQFCCEQEGDLKNNYFGILTDPGIFQLGQI